MKKTLAKVLAAAVMAGGLVAGPAVVGAEQAEVEAATYWRTKYSCIYYYHGGRSRQDCLAVTYTRDTHYRWNSEIRPRKVKVWSNWAGYFRHAKAYSRVRSDYISTTMYEYGNYFVNLGRLTPGNGVTVCYTPTASRGSTWTPGRKCINSGGLW